MALFVRQDEQRSKLQEKIAAELNEKSRPSAELENKPLPDGVEDSRYMRDYQTMSQRAWIWILIILLAVSGLIIWALL